eukprot:364707-Chlamydomonas_euryale.AAC.20
MRGLVRCVGPALNRLAIKPLLKIAGRTSRQCSFSNAMLSHQLRSTLSERGAPRPPGQAGVPPPSLLCGAAASSRCVGKPRTSVVAAGERRSANRTKWASERGSTEVEADANAIVDDKSSVAALPVAVGVPAAGKAAPGDLVSWVTGLEARTHSRGVGLSGVRAPGCFRSTYRSKLSFKECMRIVYKIFRLVEGEQLAVSWPAWHARMRASIPRWSIPVLAKLGFDGHASHNTIAFTVISASQLFSGLPPSLGWPALSPDLRSVPCRPPHVHAGNEATGRVLRSRQPVVTGELLALWQMHTSSAAVLNVPASAFQSPPTHTHRSTPPALTASRVPKYHIFSVPAIMHVNSPAFGHTAYIHNTHHNRSGVGCGR